MNTLYIFLKIIDLSYFSGFRRTMSLSFTSDRKAYTRTEDANVKQACAVNVTKCYGQSKKARE